MNENVVLLDEPQKIADGIYWVGKRSKKELEVNVYLRVFEGNGRTINMLIDPGPTTDVGIISDKIEKVLGPNFKIHFAFINHQDPDVAMNAVYFQRHFPSMQIITTEDTWRLIRFFGLKQERFIAVEKYKSKRISLKTGHKLVFIPTPYCHFRGACAIYDETEQVLFSGDLFGGLSDKPDLFADESYWNGMKIFHQIYMPANVALSNAVSAIRRVNPAPKMIVPQHGSIIRGDLVNVFMEKIENLKVGLDLSTNNTLHVESHINAANDILKNIKYKVNEAIVADLLEAFKSDGSFPEIIIFNKDNAVIGFNISLEDAFQMFVDKLIVGRGSEEKEDIRRIILDAMARWNLSDEQIKIENGEENMLPSENDSITEADGEAPPAKPIEKLNVTNLLAYFIEQGGGEEYSQLLGFRMILKIPLFVLKENKVETFDDLKKIGETDDAEFAAYLLKAVESVLGHVVPQELLTT